MKKLRNCITVVNIVIGEWLHKKKNNNMFNCACVRPYWECIDNQQSWITSNYFFSNIVFHTDLKVFSYNKYIAIVYSSFKNVIAVIE